MEFLERFFIGVLIAAILWICLRLWLIKLTVETILAVAIIFLQWFHKIYQVTLIVVFKIPLVWRIYFNYRRKNMKRFIENILACILLVAEAIPKKVIKTLFLIVLSIWCCTMICWLIQYFGIAHLVFTIVQIVFITTAIVFLICTFVHSEGWQNHCDVCDRLFGD